MKIPFLFTSLFFFSLAEVRAQDTLRVMQYNILNYRNTTQQCNGTTNNSSNKEANISKIIAATLPDVLVINEMGADFRNPIFLLDNALNKDGRTFYEPAAYSNLTSSSLVNMLYYNKNKLALQSQTAISNGTDQRQLIRQADVYRLYHKASVRGRDTLFLHVIAVHLKAGNTTADEQERARQTDAIMDYVKKFIPDNENVVVAGDFNVQSGFVTSYSNLVAREEASVRFYDPKDARGNWNENASFANLHTQSTRTTATSGGCFSGGGMDDRLDFILCNQRLMQGSRRMTCLSQTYKAIGQDGQRFNQDINTGRNFAVSTEIANALYEVSDHLPVYVELAVGSLSYVRTSLSEHQIQVTNPSNKELKMAFQGLEGETLQMELYNNKAQQLAIKTSLCNHPLERLIWETDLAPGFYVLKVTTLDGRFLYRKLIIE